MHIITKYINEEGYIRNIFYKISHNIINDAQIEILQKNVLNEMRDSIIILRGISDYTSLTCDGNKLYTDQYKIEFKNYPFKFLQMPEPAFGSAIECMTNNLSMFTQKECYKVQSFFDNIRIVMLPLDVQSDKFILVLNEIRSNGIYSHIYELSFGFDSNWTSTCQECQNGMLHLRQELSKLSDELYADPNDKSIYFEGKIITDFKVNDKNALKVQLMSILKNAFDLARISNIEINELIL